MRTGWALDAGNWYYLRDNGAMATGWVRLGPDWHRFSESGEWIG